MSLSIFLPSAMTLISLMTVLGCQSDLAVIDQEVEQLLQQTTAQLGPLPGAPPPRVLVAGSQSDWDQTQVASTSLPSENPTAETLRFEALEQAEAESEAVIWRLEQFETQARADAQVMDLPLALTYALESGREYKFAEESYVLACLRLLVEEHRWGPRFFNDTSAAITGSGDDGLFDTALLLINDFQITQRLPYGGEVSARALATATEDLHERVSGEGVQSLDLILEADLPLLRDAGTIAREDLIQRRRDIIYAARDFEDFRRAYLVDIAVQFLDLVVSQRGIANAQRQVESLTAIEAREQRLYQEGRQPQFEAALAANDAIRARDDLSRLRERYRVDVDRFKLLIGMPIEQNLTIVDQPLNLPVPRIDLAEAVTAAMAYRLDLQNSRDRTDDARRAVDNAHNQLLPDLDLDGSITIPSRPNRFGAPEPDNSTFEAGVTFSWPLDRRIEELNVRQAQIALERQRRSYDEQRDAIAVDVRAAVRGIDTALFSVRIQERGIEIAEQRKASLEADPARATARDFTDAEAALLNARDSFDRAQQDLDVAILEYLRDTGQIRFAPDGSIRALGGVPMGPAAGDPPDLGSEEAFGGID